RHSYAHGDGHLNTDPNAYARGQTYADAQAAADASSAGAALIGTLNGGNSRSQFASSPPEADRRATASRSDRVAAIPEKRGDGAYALTRSSRDCRKETEQEACVGFARSPLGGSIA